MPGNIVSQGSMLISFKDKTTRAFSASNPTYEERTIYSNTAKEILLKYEIEGKKINIIVNREQRPTTSILASQGDHITAYTVLLQTICNLIDGEEEHEAPKILYEATSCFFEDLETLDFKSYKTNRLIDFKSKLKEVTAKFFPKKIRKKLIESLKTIQNCDTAFNSIDNPELKDALLFINSYNSRGKRKLNLNKLNDCIKRSNRGIFAQLVVELGEQILKKYNHKTTAALPKLREDLEKNPTEGNRVKTAMLNLRLLNKLLMLQVNINIPNVEELIKDFKITCGNIIKATIPQIKDERNINNKFNSCLVMVFNFDKKLQQTKIDLSNIGEYLKKINLNKNIKAKEIGKLFNDLFDFKQNKIRQANTYEQDGQLVDHGTKIALHDPLACLYEVTSRHANFMFKAFNNLTLLSEELKLKIIDEFHEKIIEKSSNLADNCQGWGEWKIINPIIGTSIYFNKQQLDEGVREYNNKHSYVKEYPKAKKRKLLPTYTLSQ